MHSIAGTVILSRGWRRRVIAFFAGAVGALALAPVDFFPAMLIPMTIAVWLIDGTIEAESGEPLSISSALKKAFGAGWWWGFGYFVAGFWWLGAAFLVEPRDFVWAMPLGIFGLPAGLAIFPAIGFTCARFIWAPGASRILALAAGLGFSEWLRAHVLTGFPWNDYGMALGDQLVLAQFAAIGGLASLNTLSVAIFAAPALFADRAPKSLGWRIPRGIVVAAAALAGLAVFGAVRLAGPTPAPVAAAKVRLMQPNLVEDEKFSAAYKDEIVAHYLTLSDRTTGPEHKGLADVTLLVWPESAFPFVLTEDHDALAAIGGALPATTTLATGAARIGMSPTEHSRPGFFNSILVIARGGIILDTYDKVHLVPFGEYLPMEWLLHKLGLHHFVHVPGGFQKGAAHSLLRFPGLPPALPLICYEALFPEEALPVAGPKAAESAEPGFILNVTNDAWFGHTAGPYQHFAQARLLTIEQGLPMLRGANTGISAIIDARGRVLNELPLGKEGVVDGVLPGKIAQPPYARAPFLIGFLPWLGALLASFVLRLLV